MPALFAGICSQEFNPRNAARMMVPCPHHRAKQGIRTRVQKRGIARSGLLAMPFCPNNMTRDSAGIGKGPQRGFAPAP